MIIIQTEPKKNIQSFIINRVTGQVFVNEYDLGTIRNLQEFFNVGRHRHWITIFLPVPCLPSGDGTKFVNFAEFIREDVETLF